MRALPARRPEMQQWQRQLLSRHQWRLLRSLQQPQPMMVRTQLPMMLIWRTQLKVRWMSRTQPRPRVQQKPRMQQKRHQRLPQWSLPQLRQRTQPQ